MNKSILTLDELYHAHKGPQLHGEPLTESALRAARDLLYEEVAYQRSAVPDVIWWANELSLMPLGERVSFVADCLRDLLDRGVVNEEELYECAETVAKGYVGKPYNLVYLGGLWVRQLSYLHRAREQQQPGAYLVQVLLHLYIVTQACPNV